MCCFSLPNLCCLRSVDCLLFGMVVCSLLVVRCLMWCVWRGCCSFVCIALYGSLVLCCLLIVFLFVLCCRILVSRRRCVLLLVVSSFGIWCFLVCVFGG